MSASLLISREDPGVLGTHCVSATGCPPPSLSIYLSKTGQNKTKQALLGSPFQDKVKGWSPCLVGGVGGQAAGSWGNSKRDSLLFTGRTFPWWAWFWGLGNFGASSGLAWGPWSLLIHLLSPTLSAACMIWGASQFLPSCCWQWNKDRTGHAGTVYPLMVPPAHLHLPKGPLLSLPLCSPRRASCTLPHFPPRCLCLWWPDDPAGDQPTPEATALRALQPRSRFHSCQGACGQW